jgi:HAMP domain-containing protein
MTDQATPAKVRLTDGLGPLREAVNEVMRYTFTNTRPAMHALQVLIDEADAAADEIDRLRSELGECSGALEAVGHPIEWQRRIDEAVAAERERWQTIVQCAHKCEDGQGACVEIEDPDHRHHTPCDATNCQAFIDLAARKRSGPNVF